MAVSIGVEEEAGGVEGLKLLIDANRGNLAAIARQLNVHRTSVLRVIQKYPELQEWLRSAREATFDDVENAMINAALNGCAIRQIFYLKTQGHLIGRPYQERPTQDELSDKGNNGPVTLEEWRQKRLTKRAEVTAMLEDFTIEGEAERVE
ncbi:MAG: hypothetical protein KDE53_27730 [Caldilineaceae bacterium]|nr:hypothetical protein [Caldilineaceae bacterium]